MAHHILEIYAKGANGKDPMRDQFLDIYAVCYGTGHQLHTYRFVHNKENGQFLDLDAGIENMCWGTLKMTGLIRITDMVTSQLKSDLSFNIDEIRRKRSAAAEEEKPAYVDVCQRMLSIIEDAANRVLRDPAAINADYNDLHSIVKRNVS